MKSTVKIDSSQSGQIAREKDVRDVRIMKVSLYILCQIIDNICQKIDNICQKIDNIYRKIDNMIVLDIKTKRND